MAQKAGFAARFLWALEIPARRVDIVAINGDVQMPVVFVGHGSPMNAIEDNPWRREWQRLGATPPRPRAVVCVSAHWETHGVAVTASAKPETVHDFFGYSRELFGVEHAAPGDPELPRDIAHRVSDDTNPIHLDPYRGLDHGAWSVLCAMYPRADVPVVQLRLDTRRRGHGIRACAAPRIPA